MKICQNILFSVVIFSCFFNIVICFFDRSEILEDVETYEHVYQIYSESDDWRYTSVDSFRYFRLISGLYSFIGLLVSIAGILSNNLRLKLLLIVVVIALFYVLFYKIQWSGY